MRNIYTTLLLVFAISAGYAQTYSTDANGNWNVINTWTDDNLPGRIEGVDNDIVLTRANAGTNVVIKDTVIVPNNLIFARENNEQPPRLSINPGGYLKVKGDIVYRDQARPSIIVEGTSSALATLEVRGGFEFTSNSNSSNIFFRNAVVSIDEDLDILSGGNLELNLNENVVLYVQGNFTAIQKQIINSTENSALMVDGITTLESGTQGALNGKTLFGDTLIGQNNIDLDYPDQLEIYSDNGIDIPNDGRESFEDNDTTSLSGSVLDFARLYPHFCAYSTKCRIACASVESDSIRAICSDDPLPVTWGEVTVTEEFGIIHVNWSTYSESNNEYFEIYKSENGTSWYSIGSTQGAGNSKDYLEYSFPDAETVTSTVYYKIKQVDYDGKEEFSKIAVYIPEAGGDFKNGIYPNPNSGEFFFSLDTDTETVTSVTLLSVSGEETSSGYAQINNLVKVSAPSVVSGYYTAIIKTESNVYQSHFVIK